MVSNYGDRKSSKDRVSLVANGGSNPLKCSPCHGGNFLGFLESLKVVPLTWPLAETLWRRFFYCPNIFCQAVFKVGVFNPFAKYAQVNLDHFAPRIGVKIKNVYNHHLLNPRGGWREQLFPVNCSWPVHRGPHGSGTPMKK